MNNLLSWLLEPAISLGMFYIAYLLFLKREAFFNAHRFYFLTAVFFSAALPFFSFVSPVSLVNYSFLMPGVTVSSSAAEQQMAAAGAVPAWSLIFITLYFTVAAFLLLRFLIRLAQISLLVIRNKTRNYKNALIVEIQSGQPPFSFLNFIFMNSGKYEAEEERKIIEHELAHVNQYHTLDLIVLELITIFQWFNPFAWLTRLAVIEVHEYLADEEVIGRGTSISFYQQLLLNIQTEKNFLLPVNNFNKSLTLNRIKMMTTIKPPAWKKIKILLLFPVVLALVFMCTKVDEERSALTGQHETVQENVGPEEVFHIVEEMPDFQGGKQDAFRVYISENLVYPEDAIKNGIEGRVFVQFTVTSDGSVTDAQIVRGAHPSLDKEALRVVRSSPRWEPGKQRGEAVNVAFTFPITFVLNQLTRD
jgi:TonB family protein